MLKYWVWNGIDQCIQPARHIHRLPTTDQEQYRCLLKAIRVRMDPCSPNSCCSSANWILYLPPLIGLSSLLFLACIFSSLPFSVFSLLPSAVACVLPQGSLFILPQISVYWGVFIGRITVMNSKGRKEGKCEPSFLFLSRLKSFLYTGEWGLAPMAYRKRSLCIFSTSLPYIGTWNTTAVGPYIYTDPVMHLPTPSLEAPGAVVQGLERKAGAQFVSQFCH